MAPCPSRMFANDRPRRALSPRPAQRTTAHPRAQDVLQPRRQRFVRAARLSQESAARDRSRCHQKGRLLSYSMAEAQWPCDHVHTVACSTRRGGRRVVVEGGDGFLRASGGVQSARPRRTRPRCFRASRVTCACFDAPLRSPRESHRPRGAWQLAPDDLNHVQPPRLPRSLVDGRTEERATLKGLCSACVA